MFSRKTNKKGQSSATPRRGCRPQIESLEQRSCLSVTVGLDNATGLLSITGDDAPDTITVTHADNDNLITVQHGLTEYTFVANNVEKMVVNLGGGNDSYTEILKQDSDFFRTFPTEINMAGGKDTVRLDLAGNAFHWATLKEDIEFKVTTGAGMDKVQVNIPYVEIANHLDVDIWLGAGKDQLAAIAFGSVGVQGSMYLTANGEAGGDVMNYYGTYDPNNPAGGIRVADQAVMSVYFDGGAGKDRLNVDYAGEVDGLCSIYLHGDATAGGVQRDRVSLHTSTKTGSTGDLYGYVLGGEGNDALTLLAEGDVPPAASLNANGQDGIDSCVNTFNVVVQNCEA